MDATCMHNHYRLVFKMTRIKQTLIATAAIAFISTPLHANDFLQNTYIGVSGGTSFAADEDADDEKVEYDAGFNFAVNAGYRFNDMLRIQADLGYLRNSFAKFGDAEIKDGKLSGTYAVGSLYVDYKLTDKFTPFAGVGIGAIAPSIGKIDFKDSSVPDFKLKSKKSVVPLFKLSAGASYSVAGTCQRL